MGVESIFFFNSTSVLRADQANSGTWMCCLWHRQAKLVSAYSAQGQSHQSPAAPGLAMCFWLLPGTCLIACQVVLWCFASKEPTLKGRKRKKKRKKWLPFFWFSVLNILLLGWSEMITNASRKDRIENPIGKRWTMIRSNFLLAVSYKMALVVL